MQCAIGLQRQCKQLVNNIRRQRITAGSLLQKHRIHYETLPTDETVFSAIQPTGIPHLGNWLGTLKRWVALQESESRLYFALADLHAITTYQDSVKLRRWRMQSLATLLAIGLDPQRCTIFYQSDVAAHSELMWILTCLSPVGYLSRMTAWKSKAPSSVNDDITTGVAAKAKAKLGLLAYPVLQAADILVHGYVPVGSDQTQHLEFAQECARQFNNSCGQRVLQEPKALYSSAPRVMSLRDPQHKMSKSHPDPRSRILLTDSPDEIHKKVMASLTDSIDGVSFDPNKRPGVSNLLSILSYLDDSKATEEEVAELLCGQSLKGLKELLAERLTNSLYPIRESYRELTGRKSGLVKLEEIAETGAVAAKHNANKTMKKVRDAIGL